MTVPLSEFLDSQVASVSQLCDDDLRACSDLLERALIHFLVEHQMREPGVSPLRVLQEVAHSLSWPTSPRTARCVRMVSGTSLSPRG